MFDILQGCGDPEFLAGFRGMLSGVFVHPVLLFFGCLQLKTVSLFPTICHFVSTNRLEHCMALGNSSMVNSFNKREFESF